MHLVEDGFEQSVIARVKSLRAEGHAMTRIAKVLDAVGVRPRSDRPWHPQQIAWMLNRPNGYPRIGSAPQAS